jgi:hypothetical protein
LVLSVGWWCYLFDLSLLRIGLTNNKRREETMKNTMDPAVVKVVAKCSDQCYVEVLDSKGNRIAEHGGYVPDFMPGEHYGDYVELEIDIKTGKILNWNPKNKLSDFIQENQI